MFFGTFYKYHTTRYTSSAYPAIMKEPKCTICGGRHYRSFCFQAPRKKILSKQPIRKAQKPIRRSRVKVQSTSVRSRTMKEADRLFSIYIRKKDSVNGYARCVTCGHQAKWQTLENGHYLSRRYIQIRWDDMNCHVQCKRCNQELGGNLVKYRKYLTGLYGYDPTDMLKQRVKTKGKVTLSDIKSVIDKYS